MKVVIVILAPGGLQLVHDVEPMRLEYVPVGHNRHIELPAPAL